MLFRSFTEKDVMGYVGGGPSRPVCAPKFPQFAKRTFRCPNCDSLVVGGQLLCVQCTCVFLFVGQKRLYSPILDGVIESLPETTRATLTASVSRIARKVVYKDSGTRSMRGILARLFKPAMKHRERWDFDTGFSDDDKVKKAIGRAHV